MLHLLHSSASMTRKLQKQYQSFEVAPHAGYYGCVHVPFMSAAKAVGILRHLKSSETFAVFVAHAGATSQKE